jgi:hypothetical protein
VVGESLSGGAVTTAAAAAAAAAAGVGVIGSALDFHQRWEHKPPPGPPEANGLTGWVDTHNEYHENWITWPKLLNTAEFLIYLIMGRANPACRVARASRRHSIAGGLGEANGEAVTRWFNFVQMFGLTVGGRVCGWCGVVVDRWVTVSSP